MKSVMLTTILTLINDYLNIENDNSISIDLTNYSEVGHTHEITDITDLQTTLDSKVNANHTHPSSSITDFKSTIIDLVNPVGSIYTSMDSTSPAEKFGGTWEQIVDRFLYCASSSGTTGGSTTITTANLPSHTHTFSGTNVSDSLFFK